MFPGEWWGEIRERVSPLHVGIRIRLWISGFGGRTDRQRESFEGGGLKFVVGNNVTRIPVYRRV